MGHMKQVNNSDHELYALIPCGYFDLQYNIWNIYKVRIAFFPNHFPYI